MIGLLEHVDGRDKPGHDEKEQWRTLTDAACAVLTTSEPAAKVALSQRIAAAWRAGELGILGTARPPDRPSRPTRPELKAPRDMKRRRGGGSLENRIALLHAIAHIELNAIDLAWDLIARFAAPELSREFFDDWVGVAAEEAAHHAVIVRRLGELGGAYGDLPAHDGLWEAAQATAHDLWRDLPSCRSSSKRAAST